MKSTIPGGNVRSVSTAASPICTQCHSAPRDGRSLRCESCRATHRRARKADTQRARRATARRDTEIESLLADLRLNANRLAAHLERQQQQAEAAGKSLNTVQINALHLTRQCLTLIEQVEQRGLRPPRSDDPTSSEAPQ